jgi:TolA-binding protein
MSDNHGRIVRMRTDWERTAMAKSPLDRLASLGEDVLGKASKNPTAARMVQRAAQLKDRVDDLSKRVRGLEAMEKRLAQLEQRVAKLEGARSKPSATAKKSATKK